MWNASSPPSDASRSSCDARNSCTSCMYVVREALSSSNAELTRLEPPAASTSIKQYVRISGELQSCWWLRKVTGGACAMTICARTSCKMSGMCRTSSTGRTSKLEPARKSDLIATDQEDPPCSRSSRNTFLADLPSVIRNSANSAHVCATPCTCMNWSEMVPRNGPAAGAMMRILGRPVRESHHERTASAEPKRSTVGRVSETKRRNCVCMTSSSMKAACKSSGSAPRAKRKTSGVMATRCGKNLKAPRSLIMSTRPNLAMCLYLWAVSSQTG
mmetsp:Transcript_38625/g.111464  ORF Transcript_38625/g.111464 Transcript_38625/m.111464 type:complete len:273 (-) Transcript_38625:1099-1917(-)